MREKVVSVIFVLVFCVLHIRAKPTSKAPFVIFQPGEFFDPFTDHQASASVTPQPVVLFGATKDIFNQQKPFWHLPKPSSSNSYPRTIGQASGSAALIDAQIRQPNNVPQVATFDPLTWNIQLKPTTKQFNPFGISTNLNKEYVQPKATHGIGAQLRNPGGHPIKPSALVAEASGASNSLVEQLNEFTNHPSVHGVSKSRGKGNSHKSGYHKSHADKDVKDYKSDHHKNVKDFKKYDDHNKLAHHSERGGHQDERHDEAGHYKKHHEGKKSHKAAKFGEKKGHKRGHKTKGFHNKFHRDEFHREHRFYDDYNREGYHEKHGDSHSHYKKKQGGHKKGGGHNSGRSNKKHGKKGYTDKGNVEDEHKGFDKEDGSKKYHKHHKDYHKKQGNSKGSHFGHSSEH